MNTKYETVIGLEVHVELNTKTKMFCRCSAYYFGEGPNSHTCPVCLGLPGAVPYINEEAIESCMKIGLALSCSINDRSLFERKNYFYPDLSKGYQISQLRWPLCINGSIEIEDDKGVKRTIRINRAHQEEDTGKLTHSGSETLIDFNRSGVPLVEIVTEPDFNESSQIRDYAKKLQQILRYLGVSSADMEKGEMRLEANVSVRPVGQKELPPYRVELKNINSFRFMVAAVEYEIKRQIEATEKGEKLYQETRGWNEDKKQTYLQRSKEDANDYRYFPEPDLPELAIDQDRIAKLKENLPELPSQKVKRYIADFGISEANAKILSDTKELADFFELVVREGAKSQVEPKQIANIMINQKIEAGSKTAEEVIGIVLEKKSGIIDDEETLTKLASEVIAENEASVNAYRAGKEVAIQALIGGMMRKTQGKADVSKVKPLLEKLLKN